MVSQYYIYIITNKKNTTLYVGVTNSLVRRIEEHKKALIKGFSSRYNLNKLVYYEVYSEIETAILREKQLKKYTRRKKIELIEKMNNEWKDLYEDIITDYFSG